MDVYYVDMFGTCVGYVCADHKMIALLKASQAVGFDWMGEYIYHYPGRINDGSKIQELIKDDKNFQFTYNHFIESEERKNDYFILYIGEVTGETYQSEIYEDACFIDEVIPSSVLIAPKIDEVKECDKFFDQFKLEDMWFCEDWIEE